MLASISSSFPGNKKEDNKEGEKASQDKPEESSIDSSETSDEASNLQAKSESIQAEFDVQEDSASTSVSLGGQNLLVGEGGGVSGGDMDKEAAQTQERIVISEIVISEIMWAI